MLLLSSSGVLLLRTHETLHLSPAQILFSGNFCEECRGQMTENIRFHKNNITLTDAEKSREKIGWAGVTLASLSSGRKLKLRLKIVSISLRDPFQLLDI